jgi:hypothetical protein
MSPCREGFELAGDVLASRQTGVDRPEKMGKLI